MREPRPVPCTPSPMVRKRKARHLVTGKRGERAAALYLLLRGYRILERNFLCPLGEIDIVALKKGVIVFVEVRTRQAGFPGDPIESINDLKLARIMDAARYYLAFRGKAGAKCRFDFISVKPRGFPRSPIRHYADALRTTDERARTGKRLRIWLRKRSGHRKTKRSFDRVMDEKRTDSS